MEKKVRKRNRKLRAVRRKQESGKLNREVVFRRDNYICYICGVQVRDIVNHPRQATLDHVIPLSKGGSHTYKNVRTCCRTCNSNKGSN